MAESGAKGPSSGNAEQRQVDRARIVMGRERPELREAIEGVILKLDTIYQAGR